MRGVGDTCCRDARVLLGQGLDALGSQLDPGAHASGRGCERDGQLPG